MSEEIWGSREDYTGTVLKNGDVNLFCCVVQVLYLQQELAKQQTLEQQRFKQALEKQRLETQMAAAEKVRCFNTL